LAHPAKDRMMSAQMIVTVNMIFLFIFPLFPLFTRNE